MSSSNFWDDQRLASDIISELNNKQSILKQYESLSKNIRDFLDAYEMGYIEDEDFFNMLSESLYPTIIKEYDSIEQAVLLSEDYDSLNAIIEIHPGAGGTESQDWALMLYRMYVRYCESNNFKIETLNYEQALDAGIKSVSMIIRGCNAYGLLKGERGVHRLVRISPFDASSRRHTSFASVDVIPEFSESVDVVIDEKDLRIDTYRASGAGGQHINKTDSAVRITHIPSGIVVTSQNQRSQIQNKECCLNTLKSKLFQKQLDEKKNNIDSIRGEQKSIEWGSQIRSYVFCPYTLVKDNRSNYESSDVHGVLDGNLNKLIRAYLKTRK